MNKLKTTINIDSELWKKFSHLVIEKRGYRKKNEIIEQLIREYVQRSEGNKNHEINKAIILAAGIGSRLIPLTSNVPKCLLKINSITILEHQVRNLKECGIKEITLVSGYRSDKIFRFCQENSIDINLVYNKNYADTSNLYSLWFARSHIKGGFVCLNSDVVFDVEILKNLINSEGEICLAIDKKECIEEDMKVTVENGFVTKIGKRIPREKVYGEFIGISKFTEKGSEKLFQILSNVSMDSKRSGYVALGIQQLINQGYKVNEFKIRRRFWADIDFIEDLNEVRAYLLTRPL